MGRQGGAENGDRVDETVFPSRSEIAAPLVASSKDRLEYIAAMIRELKIMSAQADCEALADLLERAYREAVRQSLAQEKGSDPYSIKSSG
jgi:hypothetical protein